MPAVAHWGDMTVFRDEAGPVKSDWTLLGEEADPRSGRITLRGPGAAIRPEIVPWGD